MKTINSQNRATLEEGLSFYKRLDENQIILADIHDNFALYYRNDDFTGHVVEVDGVGYEFITSMIDSKGDERSW